MEVLYAVCCGLDVHKASVTACLRSPGDGPQRRQEVRTFGTTTRELLRLADWLTAAGCTHVAMESTGVYWRPGLQPPRGELRALPGERPAREDGAGPQDGCARQRVARPAARTRAAPPQLRAPGGAARAPRRGALPQAA